MKRHLLTAAVVLIAIVGMVAVFAQVTRNSQAAAPSISAKEKANLDWPQWRGPKRDGISTETGLLKEWPADGPALLWQVEGLGGGYSSVAIADGKIITLGERKGKTQLVALNVKDGSELWSADVGGGSPNCTPTVDGELVFALARDGALACVKTATGEVVWQKHMVNDFGGRVPTWGYSESPLVDGDRLICSPGSAEALIAALDKKTGDVIWKTPTPEELQRGGHGGAGYSSVVITNAAGVRQYVQLVGNGVVGVETKNGKALWSYPRIANGTANIPTPLVDGDYVFCSSGYGKGAALLHLVKSGSGVEAREEYFLKGDELQNHHGGMILKDGYVYCGHGHNNGFPACLEMKTGKLAWGPNRGPGGGSAAIVYADGHIYFRYQDGKMALVEATPDGYNLKSTFKIASNRGQSWPHPVIHAGRLYLRDQDALLCYDIKR